MSKQTISRSIQTCCEEIEESQQHLLSCSKKRVDGKIEYQDLFGSNLSKQVNISRILKKRFCKRNQNTFAKDGLSNPV